MNTTVNGIMAIVRIVVVLVTVLIRSTWDMVGYVWAFCHAGKPAAPPAKKKGKKNQGASAGTSGGGEFFGRVLICVALPVYLFWWFSRERPWMWWVLVPAWFFLAIGLGVNRGDFNEWLEEAEEDAEAEAEDHEPVGEEDPESEEGPGEEDPEEDEDDAKEKARKVAEIRLRVEHEVAAAVQAGKKGASVDHLLTLFQGEGKLTDWDAPRLKEMLRGIGLPVREQMYFKVDGKKVNIPGVHVDDLTAVLKHSPRLPAHLVPDLTPTVPVIKTGHQDPGESPTSPLHLVKNTPAERDEEGAA